MSPRRAAAASQDPASSQTRFLGAAQPLKTRAAGDGDSGYRLRGARSRRPADVASVVSQDAPAPSATARRGGLRPRGDPRSLRGREGPRARRPPGARGAPCLLASPSARGSATRRPPRLSPIALPPRPGGIWRAPLSALARARKRPAAQSGGSARPAQPRSNPRRRPGGGARWDSGKSARGLKHRARRGLTRAALRPADLRRWRRRRRSCGPRPGSGRCRGGRSPSTCASCGSTRCSPRRPAGRRGAGGAGRGAAGGPATRTPPAPLNLFLRRRGTSPEERPAKAGRGGVRGVWLAVHLGAADRAPWVPLVGSALRPRAPGVF